MLLFKKIKRMAVKATGLALIGATIVGWGSTANAKETTEKAVRVVDKVETVKVDVEAIVKSISEVNLATLAGLPIVNVTKMPAIAAVQAPTYWYLLNAAGTHTVGGVAYTGLKAAVIAMQDCKDVPAQPICLFGSTNPSLPNNTLIGSPGPENRILRDN